MAANQNTVVAAIIRALQEHSESGLYLVDVRDDGSSVIIDGTVDMRAVAEEVAKTTEATTAWREWVADAGNCPVYDEGHGRCVFCGNREEAGHDAKCPYKLMREELAANRY